MLEGKVHAGDNVAAVLEDGGRIEYLSDSGDGEGVPATGMTPLTLNLPFLHKIKVWCGNCFK